MSDIDSHTNFKQKNPFARPRARDGTKKTIRTYNNPFAAKAKKKNNEGTTMQDIVNDDSENLRLKEVDTIREETQRSRPKPVIKKNNPVKKRSFGMRK